MALKQIRIKVLTRFWKTNVSQLIQSYSKGGLKAGSICKKLEEISDIKRDEIINTYYNEQRKLHLIVVGQWIKAQKAPYV